MPPRRAQTPPSDANNNLPTVPPAGGGVSTYVMPDDVRRDLLAAQRDAIQTVQSLPRIKIMPAGAGLFEFEDTNDAVRSFVGVILGSHPRNVLWDRSFGSGDALTDEEKLPACSSADGQFGTPKEGFAHPALNGATATGTERIQCARCPLNQWGTGDMYIPLKNHKGKACTNQRAVYVMVDGRQAPMELTLPPTSISPLDEYMMMLLNRQMPVQAMFTEFTQEIAGRGQTRWGVIKFTPQAALTQTQFEAILQRRVEYAAHMTPETFGAAEATVVTEAQHEVTTNDDDAAPLPF